MSEERRITHAEALELIEEHMGEKVYFGFLVCSANPTDGSVPVEHVIGELRNPLEPKPPRLEGEKALYRLGVGAGAWFGLSPMIGTVHLRENGIGFRVAEGVTIRVAWRGSPEVGDWRPTAESLARLNALGIRRPEHEKAGVVLPREKDRPSAG